MLKNNTRNQKQSSEYFKQDSAFSERNIGSCRWVFFLWSSSAS